MRAGKRVSPTRLRPDMPNHMPNRAAGVREERTRLAWSVRCGVWSWRVELSRGAGRDRTAEWRFCRPLPYHLATAPNAA